MYDTFYEQTCVYKCKNDMEVYIPNGLPKKVRLYGNFTVRTRERSSISGVHIGVPPRRFTHFNRCTNNATCIPISDMRAVIICDHNVILRPYGITTHYCAYNNNNIMLIFRLVNTYRAGFKGHSCTTCAKRAYLRIY